MFSLYSYCAIFQQLLRVKRAKWAIETIVIKGANSANPTIPVQVGGEKELDENCELFITLYLQKRESFPQTRKQKRTSNIG
jgi:hypothetical protein